MNGLGTGVYEQDESTYNNGEILEEKKLFQINESVRDLINGLERIKQEPAENESENEA